jgi:hypothetical protein
MRVIITQLPAEPDDLDGSDLWLCGGQVLAGALPPGLEPLVDASEQLRALAFEQLEQGFPTLGRLALGHEAAAPDLRFRLRGVGEDLAGWVAVFGRSGPERVDEMLAEVAGA